MAGRPSAPGCPQAARLALVKATETEKVKETEKATVTEMEKESAEALEMESAWAAASGSPTVWGMGSELQTVSAMETAKLSKTALRPGVAWR